MEGIFGNLPPRKTLSSEITKYEIFVLQDGKSEDLESCRINCLALATSLTKGYIWHNEGFNLSVSRSGDVPCLIGATDFGDFIEDEWLVVWLLYGITKVFTNVAARIKDSDGEFLLIEAADHLPKWLSVDTADNRVFIHGGQMHIIQQPQTPGEISKLPIGKPTLESALESIHFYPGLTKAHINIEECVRKRISGFPNNLNVYVQKVNAYLPEDIVRILDQEPGLMSAAIRAFYFRDPIDLRACRVFKEFTPQSRVWTQIPVNRCGYAQLMQQIFKADRRSGYNIPKDCGKDFKGIDMGCKIAHGFEILCSSCQSNKFNDSKAVFDEPSFKKYIAALEKRGYFCGEIEGSKKHQELMSNARAYFIKFSTEGIDNSYTSIVKSAGERIFSAKRRLHNEFCESTSLPTENSRSMLPEEDGDEWMYLNDNKMDDMLSEMKQGFEKLGKGKLDQKSEEGDLNDLTQKMKTFISNLSDYEGVEGFGNQSEVSFDPLEFENALKRLCDIPGESDESCSDDFLSSDNTDEESEINSDGSDIVNVMERMDSELALTNVGKSFVREGEDCQKSDSGREAFTPVDIDLNMVQNFLISCESETEMPGAASTLLHSIGLGSNNAQS